MEKSNQPVIRITKPLTVRSANDLVANWRWGQPYFTTRWEDFANVRKAFNKAYGIEHMQYHLSQHECDDPTTGVSGYLFIRT